MEPKKPDPIRYADDDTMPVRRLAEMRIPSLAIGLGFGLLLSFITSRFEEVLMANIQIAFFIPIVVYMAAAVGSQTQEIYVRDLKTGKAKFRTYLLKETLLGVLLGFVSSVVVALITLVWFQSLALTLAISLAMFGAILVAPLVALIVSEVLQLEHSDPAVGAGPIATIIQDTLSIVIFGLIASAILL